ncbi:MAG: hypothetical protein ACJASF_002433 [Vicingaceae bacterium]|jgi:hypothetical protein
MYIVKNLPLNSTWNLISTNQFRVEATIDSTYTDSVNGSLDSLKTISFQYFDSNNIAIQNTINNRNIIYSKNNGIVNTINLYNTPVGSLQYAIINEFSRVYKNIALTNAAVFDYHIGDEYHLIVEEGGGSGPPSPDYINGTVINRTVSSNGDTIYVTVSEIRETNTTTVDNTVFP